MQHKAKGVVAAFLASMVVLATLVAPTASLAATAPKTTAKFSSVTDYLAQKVNWTSCGTDLYCGSVYVPMDWNNNKSESISLAVVFHRASASKPLGSIIFNPGGPGASGYDFVKNSISDLATDKLKRNYNVVGFDPRGVQNSTAVKCVSSGKALDGFVYGDTGFPLGSSEDIAETKKQIAAFSLACAKRTGKLLGFVDTISAAKDLDVLRSVMGDKKLNYLGYSYGTFLGNTYAALFPKKVGRMVLDGAIDPLVSQSVQSVNQLKGFDLALKDYLKDCLANANCPFSGSASAAETRIKNFLLALETKPILSSDHNRKVTVWMALNGIDMALYSNEYWPYLSTAFEQAFKGDGTTLQRLADFYNDRNQDGTYASNQTEANWAINCLDARESSKPSAIRAQNQRILAASNVFGRYWQFGGLACASWKYPVVKPLKSYSAKGAPTIVVVGTTGDPATPYQQAVSLAHKVLAKGFLITYQGEGHTAYGRKSTCVNNAVDDFFVAGTLPSTEPICK
jgi:pimeloyl-ACP methyl ester carboxylesterase